MRWPPGAARGRRGRRGAAARATPVAAAPTRSRNTAHRPARGRTMRRPRAGSRPAPRHDTATPSRSAVLLTSAARSGRTSAATTVPDSPTMHATCAAFPPGAAQTSSTRSPGCGSRAPTTNADAWSCTANQPCANPRSLDGSPPSSRTQSGCSRAGRGVCPLARRPRTNASTVVVHVFVRRLRRPRSPKASAATSASSSPRMRRSSRTAHGDMPVRMKMSSSVAPVGGVGGSSAIFRRIAFTKPRSRGVARSTDSDTAACRGIRMNSSWYAPSRSAARAPGLILATDRDARWPIARSSPGMWRSVPRASSVASARSRGARRERSRSAGRTRVEYASSSVTRRTVSTATDRAVVMIRAARRPDRARPAPNPRPASGASLPPRPRAG